jgi:integrase
VASLGFQMLRAFVRWCVTSPTYGAIVNPTACDGRRVTSLLGKRKPKRDAIEREQLRPWFAEVLKLPPIPSSYLRFVLLTGCRPGEAAALRWEDVDFRWLSITLRDKVEDVRTIPLTPYVASILLERRAMNERRPDAPVRIRRDAMAVAEFNDSWRPSPWVFPATRDKRGGHITKANKALERALAAAGLPHVSQHGLRRSFGSLAEWVECPIGIVAQIQGHKPSAIAEKHYRVRPIDLLRQWHTRIEAWILSEAGLCIEDTRRVVLLKGATA